MSKENGFKVLTHDHRPPIQGGEPLFDGQPFPIDLGPVRLDTSSAVCAAGFNYTAELPTALKIAGLWQSGRPSACFRVESLGQVVARDDKIRTDRLRIVSRCDRTEVVAAIRTLSEGWFASDHVDRMAESQIAWYDALGRPSRNTKKIESGLSLALKTRGLDWKLERFNSARDARDAWAARDARDARDARAAWAARAARDAWAARAARDAWDAWAARAAWDAWDAWAALIVEYAALNQWTNDDPNLLTAGLRDAYLSGLELALPTGPDTLGWAMAE